MNKKKLIILISVLIALAVLVCVGVFALSGNKASKIADKLDLGEKYLSEMEYEKALATYKEVLEIDPKSVEAYLGMAEVYIAMGEYEEALEILEEGYSQTGDAKLTTKRNQVEALISGAQETPAPTPESDSEPAPALTPELDSEPAPALTPELDSESAPAPTSEPITEPVIEDYAIDWKDPNLEWAMCCATGIFTRDIMYSDVKDITFLELYIRDISDISALSILTNLTYLDLCDNNISDISALSGLTNLTYLDLCGNQISDISALSNLKNLEYLYLYGGNPITDYSPVAHVPNVFR